VYNSFEIDVHEIKRTFEFEFYWYSKFSVYFQFLVDKNAFTIAGIEMGT
jgi:hypothetical protein